MTSLELARKGLGDPTNLHRCTAAEAIAWLEANKKDDSWDAGAFKRLHTLLRTEIRLIADDELQAVVNMKRRDIGVSGENDWGDTWSNEYRISDLKELVEGEIERRAPIRQRLADERWQRDHSEHKVTPVQAAMANGLPSVPAWLLRALFIAEAVFTDETKTAIKGRGDAIPIKLTEEQMRRLREG